MLVTSTLGICPDYWGKKKQSEFLKEFEGKAPREVLIKAHKECVKKSKKTV